MSGRQRYSNELRTELATIPNTPENFELRMKYRKMIAEAQKTEAQYRAAGRRNKRAKEKPEKNINPGLELLKKQGDKN